MKYSFILLSAGKGTRFGKEVPKQYLPFGGKPMIVHTLERIDKIEKIEDVVVCNEEYIEVIKNYASKYKLAKNIKFCIGGSTRQESVYNGLKVASNDRIILHEAARPLVSKKDFLDLIECSYENVTYAYSIPYTVLKKDSDGFVSDVLERKELINIQLPQKFVKEILIKCHEKAVLEGKTFTEDAGMLYYYLGERVFCLQGNANNIKITEYVDLLYGETLYQDGFFKE